MIKEFRPETMSIVTADLAWPYCSNCAEILRLEIKNGYEQCVHCQTIIGAVFSTGNKHLLGLA